MSSVPYALVIRHSLMKRLQGASPQAVTTATGVPAAVIRRTPENGAEISGNSS